MKISMLNCPFSKLCMRIYLHKTSPKVAEWVGAITQKNIHVRDICTFFMQI